MLFEILKRTPSWVFVLFFALLALGYWQSRSRTVPRARVAILPVAMIALSLYGVLSGFGISALAIVAWLAGVGLAVLVSARVTLVRNASYTAATQSFSLPGSWMPLVLMMCIFFTRYTVAVLLARNPMLAHDVSFIATICLLYGFLSGLFFAAALSLWRLVDREARTAST